MGSIAHFVLQTEAMSRKQEMLTPIAPGFAFVDPVDSQVRVFHEERGCLKT